MQSDSLEITMRPASYYYLANVWPYRERRQSQPGARATSRGRHARAPRRDLRRDLPVLARRVLAALSGTSQPV